MADEAHVKGRIVGHQHRSPAKLQKPPQDRADGLGSHDHGIVYACEPFDLKGNGHLRVHKLVHAVCDHPVFHPYGSDLNDLILHRGKAGGLNVKYHKSAVQALVFRVLHDLLHIVHQVSLDPVKDLEGIALIQGMAGVREGLDAAVVSHSQGRHSPLLCPFYDILYLRNAVHVAHFRMTVELHPLHRRVVHPPGGKILALFDPSDGAHGQLAVEPVDGGDPLELYELPLLYGLVGVGLLVLSQEHLDGDAVGEVGEIKDHHLAAASKLPFFHPDDLSP